MTRRDYEAAARIVQGIALDERDVETKAATEAFVAFFKCDKHNFDRFDEDRFRRACVPGANVRARG